MIGDMAPEPFYPWTVFDKTRLQRWHHEHPEHPAHNSYLTVGVLPDGRGWMEDTRERRGWIHPDEAAARAECERRLAIDPERWSDAPMPGPHP